MYQETQQPTAGVLVKTAPQLPGSTGPTGDPELAQLWQKNYKTYEEMRLDATIAFARMLCVAPLVTTGWSYENKLHAPIGAKEMCEDTLEQFRMMIVKQALEGYVDFGWSGWEVVWSVNKSGFNVPQLVKHLLQPQTIILIDESTGEYQGLRQETGKDNNQVDLTVQESLRITIDVSGTNWYGRPLLENSRQAYLSGLTVDKAANQYDTKIAGSHWIIHYPIGTSPYGDSGVETDNYKIAKDMLAAITYSSGYVVPRRIATFIDDMNKQFGEDQWKIDLISDQGKGTTGFIERQKYLDALKVRGLGFPERAILEGQFGTKAEAETHANVALVNFELRHMILCQQVNQQLTNQILSLNYGDEAIDSVIIVPIPLANVKQAFWKDLYARFLADPSILMQEYSMIDMAAFRANLDLPSAQLEDQLMDPLQPYYDQYEQYEQQPQMEQQLQV